MEEEEVLHHVEVDHQLVVVRDLAVGIRVIEVLVVVVAWISVRIYNGQENSLWYLGGVNTPCP